jgi:hypothetical protein
LGAGGEDVAVAAAVTAARSGELRGRAPQRKCGANVSFPQIEIQLSEVSTGGNGSFTPVGAEALAGGSTAHS